MKFDNRIPVYTQLINILTRDILIGEYKPGDIIPSIRELAVKYTVNQNTVLHCYKELEADGIIFSKRGLGYFVNEDQNWINNKKEENVHKLIAEFIKNMNDFNCDKEDIIRRIKESD